MNTQKIMNLAFEYALARAAIDGGGDYDTIKAFDRAESALKAAVEALVADLTACRGSVKSDYHHWDRLVKRLVGTALGDIASEEVARLGALLDHIDALMEQKKEINNKT